MNKTLQAIEAQALAALEHKVDAATARVAAHHTAWLHGAGYNGLKYLAEALQDTVTSTTLTKDDLGLDLQHCSCVFISSEVEKLLAEHGRLFLRNVRHGLYLLPQSVAGNYGIGCPVDPGFPLGGERTKNPYAEKLAAAEASGVEVDDAVWNAIAGA